MASTQTQRWPGVCDEAAKALEFFFDPTSERTAAGTENGPGWRARRRAVSRVEAEIACRGSDSGQVRRSQGQLLSKTPDLDENDIEISPARQVQNGNSGNMT